MKIFFSFFWLSIIFVLSGCATAIDGQTQPMTIRTPGAQNAKCYIQNQDMKYSIYTDQTLEITKSPHDLVVNCLADGNREKTVLVKRHLNEWTIVNVANGFVPGAAYDYFSRGAFQYPEVITVSFIAEPVRPYDLPLHAGKPVMGENMGAGEVITARTRHDVPVQLEKRDNQYSGPEDQQGDNAFERLVDELREGGNAAPVQPPAQPAYDPKEEDK